MTWKLHSLHPFERQFRAREIEEGIVEALGRVGSEVTNDEHDKNMELGCMPDIRRYQAQGLTRHQDSTK